MAEEKKTTPAPEEQRPEPPAPETPDAPTPPGPEVLTVEEQLILEHEGRAALFEMGEAIPDASELPGMTIPDPPAPEPEAQGVIPGMEGPPPPENKVIDLSSVRAGAGQEQTDPAKEGGQEWEKPQEEPEPPRRGRRPKSKEAPAQGERPKRKAAFSSAPQSRSAPAFQSRRRGWPECQAPCAPRPPTLQNPPRWRVPLRRA